jgi:hypothetical protein
LIDIDHLPDACRSTVRSASSAMLVLVLVGVFGFATFVVKCWAFVDAFRHDDQAFRAAGRFNRSLWLIILGVVVVLHFLLGGLSWVGFGGLVVVIFYIVDVRPKLT